jgi:tetratricopeptide (TPR) repeat protein
VHMPSHIDIRVGQWAQAQTANEKAIAADATYRERVPNPGFYRLYMAHNSHMLAYAAMMQGESALAIGTVKDMVAAIPPDWAKENAMFCDGFFSMPYETEMRFGRWDEILAEPDLDPAYPLSRALRLYARGVAYAAKGMVPQAQAEQKAFLAARAQVPDDAFFFNNTAHALLDVAEHLLAGEILFRDGKLDAGLAEMKEAVRREDMLRYDEPPDWIQPVRHALGASLLQCGKAAEAEAVYREDLRRLPENGWSLFGLGRSLRLQDKDAEAQGIEARFQVIWKNADVKLSSSCFCQPGV